MNEVGLKGGRHGEGETRGREAGLGHAWNKKMGYQSVPLINLTIEEGEHKEQELIFNMSCSQTVWQQIFHLVPHFCKHL